MNQLSYNWILGRFGEVYSNYNITQQGIEDQKDYEKVSSYAYKSIFIIFRILV